MRTESWSVGVRCWGLALVAALAFGCTSGPTGEVSLNVAALSAADVDRVEVTITGAGIDPPIVQELSRAGAQWRGAIGGIPAGTDRTFTVVAYDAGGTPIYEGTATGVTVVAGDSVTVVIVLQDVDEGPVGMESPPDIHSVTVVPGVLAPGEVASVSVSATDPDPGDTLTYFWHATEGPVPLPDGTFVDHMVAATTWTAPATDGVYTLTITVTDASGSARSVSVDVQVSAANARGTAQIEVTVNTWPVVTRFAAQQGLVPSAGSTSTVVTATDADGDPVTITYSQACAGGSIDAAGVFTAPTVDPTWAATGSLSSYRAEFSGGTGAVRLGDGTVLMAGGSIGGGLATDTAERFDPATGLWSAVASLATPRRQHTVVSLADGRAMVIGGYADSACWSSSIAATETFDPASGAWSTTASLNELRSHGFGVATLDDGDVLAVGGYRCDGVPPILGSVERYDATADSWTTVAPMPSARYSHTVTSLRDGRVLVAAGYTPTGPTTTAWVYDPVADTWASTGAMAVARDRHSATLLQDGRVLILGGVGSSGTLAEAEIYDPATGTWQSMEPMPVPRALHTATLLPDGRVLVAGGSNSSGLVSSSEVFDPATGLWSAPTSLVTGRHAHSASVLSDGRVLLAGGYGATAEIWSGSRLCTLTATASDGRGGTGTATATVHVTDEIRGNRAPVIDRTFQSNWEAGAGDVVDLEIMAMDPDGDPLRYAWTATTGTLSATTSASTTWTSAGANATITVRVSDAAGLWDEAVFVVDAGWLQALASVGTDTSNVVAARADRIALALDPGGPVDIGSHVGVTNESQTSVIVLDTGGELVWELPYPASTSIAGMAFDTAGNLYVVGTFSEEMPVGSLSVGAPEERITPAGLNDAFVASYRSDRTLRWARTLGTDSNDSATGVAVDWARGRLFVTGLVGPTAVDFDGVYTRPAIGVAYEGFVAALSPSSGAVLWAHTNDSTGINTTNAVAVDLSSGDIAVGGILYEGGSISLSGLTRSASTPGGDGFLARLDGATGTAEWLHGYTNAWAAVHGHVDVRSLAFDAAGRLLATIAFEGAIRRDPFEGGSTTFSLGYYDTLLTQLDALGHELWSTAFTGSGAEFARVAVANDSSLWITGSYSSGAYFSSYAAPGCSCMGGASLAGPLPAIAPGRQSGYLMHVSSTGSLLELTSLGGGVGNVTPNSVALVDRDHPVIVGDMTTAGVSAEGTTLGFLGGASDSFVWNHRGGSH
ncbi:MAG: putative Ig domain-containing protein [Sandaracinaceae bacterium]|nr:putative Ig domain-containing protein [Sandaracinaceae bacterium]